MSTFATWVHPDDPGPTDYVQEIQRRAPSNPFVDGELLLRDAGNPQDQLPYRNRALQMLFLQL